MEQYGEHIEIVYDGQCPFCSRYVSLMRLREGFRSVTLTDAREDEGAVQRARALGYDLNEGFMLWVDGTPYHGADAMQRIAVYTAPDTWFNRLNRRLFRSPRRARLLYPLLVKGRGAVLRMLRRRPL